ncbi:MAG TPA: DUF3344 domain-containing protein, partial [Methanomicrobiales archaeon]|nr:DUF3344 domain-containing protein [Methanomicrobiales archaeon]
MKRGVLFLTAAILLLPLAIAPVAGETVEDVIVTSNPLGAHIFLDGVDTGKQTNSIFAGLSEGEHTIALTLEGYKDASTTVMVTTSDSIFPDRAYVHIDMEEASEAGDNEKTLDTFEKGSVNGTIRVYRSSGAAGMVHRGESIAFSFSAPSVENATLEMARLCLYTTNSEDDTLDRGEAPRLSLRFDGRTLTLDRQYEDRNTSDSDRYVGTLCYNVKDPVKERGNHTLSVTNTGQGDAAYEVYGGVIMGLYTDKSLPRIDYWITEGSAPILADRDANPPANNASAAAVFYGDIKPSDFEAAHLMLIATAADGTEGDDNRITMNQGEWDNPLHEGANSISIAELDVRPFLKKSSNRAEVESLPVDGSGDYLEVRNAILVLAREKTSFNDLNTTTPAVNI